MDAGAANLSQPQDQNWTSTFAFCSKPYLVFRLITNFIFVMYCFPINIFIITELLKRNYRKRNNPSISPMLLSDVVLLHVNFLYAMYCFILLLLCLEELKVFQISEKFLNALCNAGFSAVPLLLLDICVDCYLAVVHPVVYMASKNLRHRTLMYITPVWVYVLVILVLSEIYNLPSFHPISVLSFYIVLPAVVFFSVSTLRVLYSTRPGNSNQERCPAKRKAFRIILIILLVIVVYYLPQVVFFTYRFIEPTNPERFLCLEYPLVKILPTILDFLTPLLMLEAGKMGSNFRVLLKSLNN